LSLLFAAAGTGGVLTSERSLRLDAALGEGKSLCMGRATRCWGAGNGTGSGDIGHG
jgi:isoaspartyl peptidase/L-asparaginase-like protein (Ntn-hydrolase superfamily)